MFRMNRMGVFIILDILDILVSSDRAAEA